MVEPGGAVPSRRLPRTNGGLLLGRRTRRRGECRIQRLQPRRERVDERHVGVVGIGDHRQSHSHHRAGFDVPYTGAVPAHVAGIAHGLVPTINHEAFVASVDGEVRWCVLEPEPIVETTGARLLQHDRRIAVQFAHRYKGVLPVDGTTLERVLGRVRIAQPGASHERRGLRFVPREVSVQRHEDEPVLLNVVPAALHLISDQPRDHLRDEVAVGLFGDERVEHDPVGASIRPEHEMGCIAVGGGEGRARGRLIGSIRDRSRDLAFDRRVIDDRPQPRERIQRKPGVGSVQRLGFRRVAITRLVAYVKRVRARRVTVLRVPEGRKLRFDVAYVRERATVWSVRHRKTGEPREHERFGGLNADVGLGIAVAGPRAEPAVAVLEAGERLDIRFDARIDLGRGRHSLTTEGREHVPQ